MDNITFYEFLDKRKQSVTDEILALSEEGRTDEANILKAKYNVYDIARSVYDASAKQAGAVETAFPALFVKITAPWKASLEVATTNGDDRKVLIEEAKLAAVAEINAGFAKLI